MDTTLTVGSQVFGEEQVERARRYHRPVYLVSALGIALNLLVLGLLSFSAIGDALYGLVEDAPWWVAAPVFTGLVVVVNSLVHTPLAYWRGYVHEHRWGFSTQTQRGWAIDRLKGLALGIVLTAVPLSALIACVHVFPGWWPVIAAVGAALFVLLVGFIAFILYRVREMRKERTEAQQHESDAGTPVG